MTLQPDIQKILSGVDLAADAPGFFSQIYSLVLSEVKFLENPLNKIIEQDAQLAKNLKDSPLQESVTIRNVLMARSLATHLISNNGGLDTSLLQEALVHFREKKYLLSNSSCHDAPRIEHILNVLELLNRDKSIAIAIKTLSKPLFFPYADQIIRDTLNLPRNHQVTDTDAKRAFLSAWLTYFRQNVGSCFATAPAIIIHDEQPHRFIKDCKDLLGMGQLKRTFGGKEYAVPFSPSWGVASLKRPIFVDRRASQISQTDGFILALESARIIDSQISFNDKKMQSMELVENALVEFKGGFTTVSNIFKQVFLKFNDLVEDDLKISQDIAPNILQQQLLFQTQSKVTGEKKRSKSDALRIFREQMFAAATTFKAMTDNALLRTWEFTLASFSESKAEFCRWNLYTSLGMSSDEKDGIGQCMFKFLTKKLEVFQAKARDLQSQYERVFLEIKALESQIKRANSDTQAGFFRVEYSGRISEMNHLLQQRDTASEKAKVISEMFPFLMKTYDAKFPEYFQEIYDADMHEEAFDLYDDSPAGFRLLFKHGRSNPSTWTMINSPDQFINFLVEFFVMTENEISHLEEMDDLQKDYVELISELVRHIRTKEFLESAFTRCAIAHKVPIPKNPLENLDKISKKPWVYTSGGSMSTLISALYGRDVAPTEVSKWVESESELCVFYADAMKEMPSNLSRPYLKSSKRSILAYSPTHAFIFKPGQTPFLQSWLEEGYTYTWVRDNLINQRKAFIQNIHLTSGMIAKIIEIFCENLPSEISHLLRRTMEHIPANTSVATFRNNFIMKLSEERWVRHLGRIPLSLEEIDATLFSSLPMTSTDNLADTVLSLLKHILGSHGINNSLFEPIHEYLSYNVSKYSYVSAVQLREITLASLLLLKQQIFFSQDMFLEVTRSMQALGFAAPMPIFFADTNWVNNFFGFVVSPSTEELELWRLDYTGLTGRPLHAWKKWLDGSDRKPWGLYIRPYEYGQE